MQVIISKAKFEEVMGMGLIDADMLKGYVINFFESSKTDNKEMMVNISEKVESGLVPVEVERTVISRETVLNLRAMGLLDETKLNSKEVVSSKFPSQYGNKQILIAFSRASETGLDELLVAPVETVAEMNNDGTLDMDAQADAAEIQYAVANDGEKF